MSDAKKHGASLKVLAAMAAASVVGGGAGGAELSYAGLKDGLRGALARDPMDSAVVTVLGGSYLFYLAEKGHNPKVTSYFDALVYVSTCMSVGYSDIFARTPAGKSIGTALMMFGPAICAAVLNPPADEPKPAAPVDPKLLEVQQAIVTKLDAILGELRARPTAA